MLFLFRKLRNKALFQHAAFTYLLYAVGEIILVVIGILIALQVNEWNNNRKNRKLEQSYHCRLLEDVIQDQDQILTLLDQTEKRIEACNDLLTLLQDEKVDLKRTSNLLMSSISMMTSTFKTSQAAFEDIKSSGNLNIMRDEQLKQQLIGYYTRMDGFIDVVDRNADGTVDLRYRKEDFAEAGWHYIDFVRESIDTGKVELESLDIADFDETKFKKLTRSEGLFYLGANARVKMLYQSMEKDIVQMKELLSTKCTR